MSEETYSSAPISFGYWKAYQADQERDHWRYTIATAAMHGLISTGRYNQADIARMAIAHADALLKALEVENE